MKGGVKKFFLLNSFRVFRFLFHFALGVLIGLALLFFLLFLVVIWAKREYSGRVYSGVYLGAANISGKTLGELEDFLLTKDEEISQRKVILLWQGNDEKRWEITPQMIDFFFEKEAMIKTAFSKGRSGNQWQDGLEIYRMLVFPRNLKPEFQYSQEKIDSVANQLSLEVDQLVQDALFEFTPSTSSGQGKVVSFQVSKEGMEVDQKQLKSLILLAFEQVDVQNPIITIDLPVNVLEPKVTTSESNRLGIEEFLAEGESFFKDSIPSRVHNIILASSHLHGIVVPPGSIFSFAEKIGKISVKTGYQQAYVIKEKKTILEDGGGVCQVSTTLFRAALNAGLPIVERQAHYYRVGYYEQGGYPPGLDATVYPPSPDLKFKNDTPGYILIQTKIDQDKKRLAFELYGTADGRQTEVSKPVIHSQTPPPEPIYVDEPTLAIGVVKRIDTAHWGAKVSFTRKVFNADDTFKEERTFWSNYVPWPAVYQRGTLQ